MPKTPYHHRSSTYFTAKHSCSSLRSTKERFLHVEIATDQRISMESLDSMTRCYPMLQQSSSAAGTGQNRLGPKRRNALLTSRFRGVCYNKKCKRWQASTNAYGKYLYLGLFATESAAAHAYDVAALKIRGHISQTNFPIRQYLDDKGALPVDECLDDTIAKLRTEAAWQLLEELDDAEAALDNPADKLALIRKRVGPRRLAGLQEELMLMLSKEPMPSRQCQGASSHGTALLQTRDAASRESSGYFLGQHFSPQPWTSLQLDQQYKPAEAHSGGGPAQLGVLMNEDELNLPSGMKESCKVDQLARQDTVRVTSKAAAIGATAGTFMASVLHPEQTILQGSLVLPRLDSAAVFGDQRMGSPGVNTGMLIDNMVLNSNWPRVSTASSMVVSAACQVPAVDLGVRPAAATSPEPTNDNQQKIPPSAQPVPAGPASHESAGAKLMGSTAGLEMTVPAAAAAMQSTAILPLGEALSSAEPALSSPQGVDDIAGLVAAGTPLAVNGSLSCVSLAWLQSHLPPHCQLQHVLNHGGGIVGVLYSQPCSAVAAGQLWGSAVWDGSCFRHSQLYGTAPEAASLCCSVMQLAAGCSSQQHQLQHE